MAALSPALPGYVPAASDADLAAAREACAERLRAQGYEQEAEAFEAGERDFSWGMLHELRRAKHG